MANGHGGARPGSGRKPKSAVEKALAGNASHRDKVIRHPSAVEPPPPTLPALDESDCPADFNLEERNVWLELAPHAMLNGTLIPATALGFRMLCRNIVTCNAYQSSVQERGSANHRGLIQRIDAELLRFGLAPIGKAMTTAEPAKPAVDPVKAKYFGGR